ncbi:MAG: hypothetical protein HY321_01620 [Armatimonadetes bacterium]|nr:hypothetical protein [Armatimonadota bacterium]
MRLSTTQPRHPAGRRAASRSPFASRRAASRLRRAPESGQALLLAVVIMLLLVFISTIFLKTVLANLGHAGRARAASNEYQAAEEGVRFADTHLTSSELGADWRPRPGYNIAQLRAQLGAQASALQSDPDWRWIQPFNPGRDRDPSDDVGGFIRYNLGDSRFLLRVTYNPLNVAVDPQTNVACPVMPDVDASAFSTTTGGFGPTALSRFIMIESVGRRGSAAEIDQEYADFLANNDPIDPTVFQRGGIASTGGVNPRFRREIIAFKAIGINNYLRFVTDRNRIGQPTYLGIDQNELHDGSDPDSPTVLDMPYRLGMDAFAFLAKGDFVGHATGAPIRVNGDLVWYGQTYPQGSAPPNNTDQPEVVLAWTDEPWNVLEVHGRVSSQGAGQGQADPARMLLRMYPRYSGGSTPAPPTRTIALPVSDDAASFNALMADPVLANRYEDSAWLTADPVTKQRTDPRRSIQRLEGPSIEEKDPATGALRYEALTRNAGSVQTTPPSQGQSAAEYGYGAGIYVDNATHSGDHRWCRGDVQYGHDPERLRNDWLRPYAQVNQAARDTGWTYPGRVYNPPGVIITLEPDWSNAGAPQTNGLIRITRSDSRGWRGPDGSRLTTKTMYFELQPGPAPKAGDPTSMEYTLMPKFWDGSEWKTINWSAQPPRWESVSSGNGRRYPFNGVIYAEGNVRIRGRLPMDTSDGGVRLTVVSRGTVYIEGNVLKGPNAPNATDSRSQIALLARDFVCLNTTSLVQVETNNRFDPVNQAGGPPYAWRFPVDPDRFFRVSWDFGIQPYALQAGDNAPAQNYYQAVPPAFFARQSAAQGPASAQFQVNPSLDPATGQITTGAYLFRLPQPPFQQNVDYDFYPLLNGQEWECLDDPNPSASPLPLPLCTQSGIPSGQKYVLRTAPGGRNDVYITNYDPGSVGGTPLSGGEYALGAVGVQPLDIVITALLYAEHRSWFVIPGTFFQDSDMGDPEPADSPRYPKRQEPLDVQIHVVGAIAEGQAASLADVTQWTSRWRGANRTPFEAAQNDPDQDWTFERRGGINYAFDPSLITDTRRVRYSGTQSDEPTYLLPGLPRLPVCPGLVYFGERPVQ